MGNLAKLKELTENPNTKAKVVLVQSLACGSKLNYVEIEALVSLDKQTLEGICAKIKESQSDTKLGSVNVSARKIANLLYTIARRAVPEGQRVDYSRNYYTITITPYVIKTCYHYAREIYQEINGDKWGGDGGAEHVE